MTCSLLHRNPDSEELHMAAAAVLAREAKQQEALALVANAKGRSGTLLRAQLALNAGDTAQVCDFAPPIPCQCTGPLSKPRHAVITIRPTRPSSGG